MPYIKQERRAVLRQKLVPMIREPLTEGELNYVITLLIHENVLRAGLCYATLNRAVGILECSKSEFIRQVVSPYEDIKKAENGPVSELDTPTSEDRNGKGD